MADTKTEKKNKKRTIKIRVGALTGKVKVGKTLRPFAKALGLI